MKTLFPSMKESSLLHLAWIVGNYIEGGGDPGRLHQGRRWRHEYRILAKALEVVGYARGAARVRTWAGRRPKTWWWPLTADIGDIDGEPRSALRQAALEHLAGLAIAYLSEGRDPGRLMLGLRSKAQYEALATALEERGAYEASGCVRAWIGRQKLCARVVDWLKALPPIVTDP